jgi:1-acyl-sn-glycerol-3-phosphate acyltransferase
LSRVPALPPCFPRRGNAFSRLLGRAALAVCGWRIEGDFPDQPKLLAIVAPHTSNWDFPLGIAAVYALGLRVRFLGKHTLFYPPLGWLMRWFGGTPVVRDAPQGAVAQVVEVFQREPAIFLAVAPAGSGFYHMAHAANVPIIPIAFDGGRRAIRVFSLFRTTGDYDVDLPRLLALYDGIRGVKA